MRILRASVTFALVLCCTAVSAQELSKRPDHEAKPKPTPAAAKAPNSDATYKQLREVGVGSETTAVNNLILKRDAGVFTFKSGAFSFLAPVNGKVTGAVFSGIGTFSLVPPLASEKHSVSILTKEQAVNEKFDRLVLRFTDGTYDEIKKAGSTATNQSDHSDLDEIRRALKKHLHYNLDGRILQDVLSTEPGGLFIAFIRGKKYSSKEIFAVDPRGALEYAPEEVVFQTWDDEKHGTWAAFHYSDEYKTGTAKGTQQTRPFFIQEHALDTQIEKSGKLNGDATSHVVSRINGLRVLPLDLFSTLRVQSVTGESGEALDFIQENKDDDPDFYVILPKTLNAGEKYTIRTIYSGKDAVANTGGGNYFPVARESWYPNTGFGDYSQYDLSFRIPSKMKMVATGTLIKEAEEGDSNVSSWKSEVPQAVAGFNFGKFKRKSVNLDDIHYLVESYANEEQPDWVRSIQNIAEGNSLEKRGASMYNKPQVALGNMSTVTMMDKTLAEAQLAVELYTDFFGAAPYKRVAVTQQTACNFGQAWPTLVYLPICSFFDSTVRHQLGMDDSRGYWKVVGPHEVAHQWWGHAVGFSSYRDQWMSEGFSELSASLFLQRVYGMDQYNQFWKDERELLVEKNREGFRAIDVGPLTMGYRLNNSKTGVSVTRRLIYPKGGYILHMVRMMLWTPQDGDKAFKDLMDNFVSTYYNKPASTEDFKAMLEKHMTPGMDLDGNHRMDWFFNSYVYGTALPAYHFDQSVESTDKGVVLNFKLTQSNVTPEFKMLVPLYLEMSNGKVVRLGSANITGNNTVQQKVPVGQMKDVPKRILINYYNDVLATSN